MRRIAELFKIRQTPIISFEIFPPRTPEGEKALFEHGLPEMVELRPAYFSVTYGAGGSAQAKTVELVQRLAQDYNANVVAHLTCIEATKSKITELLQTYQRIGCVNILALRGDPPRDAQEKIFKSDFKYAIDLVRFIKATGDFCVGVAGFPEGHPECQGGKHINWQHLIQKIEAGAEFVITQLFFDNRDYFEFAEFLSRQGIKVPIIPGIIPITSAKQIFRFSELCGARIPDKIKGALERFGEKDDEVTRFGTDYAISQCSELINAGVPGIHFYTLNRVEPTRTILQTLGFV